MKENTKNIKIGDTFLVKVAGIYDDRFDIMTGRENYLDKKAEYYTIEIKSKKIAITTITDEKI